MKIIKPSYEITYPIPFNRKDMLKCIELAGRTCYKSDDKITEDSASKFVKMIMKSGHHSVIEHVSLSVRFIVNRGVTHELVRHRLASYSQESTRFCDYTNPRFDGVIFILPCWMDDSYLGEYDYREYTSGMIIPKTPEQIWLYSIALAEAYYVQLREKGWSAQQARCVLPIGLKTEIVTTCNVREWLWIFKKRCYPDAHPQIREVMVPLEEELKEKLPEIFDFELM